MKCKKCGADLKENSRFCSKCGQRVEEAAVQEAATVEQTVSKASSGAAIPQKNRRKGCLLGLLAGLLILLAVAAGAAVFYKTVWQKRSGEDNDSGWKTEKSQVNDDDDETDDMQDEDLEKHDEDVIGRLGAAESSGAETTQRAMEATAVPENPVVSEPTSDSADEESENHRYEIVVKDCTWTQAYDDAKARGGYLVHINTQDEYDYIQSNLLNTESSRKLKLWIGGVRASGTYEYHWANADGTFGQEILNSSDYTGVWMDGEPSFRDNSIGRDEYYMNIFYYKRDKRWVWNDVPDDIIAAISSYKGTVGYICEYDR